MLVFGFDGGWLAEVDFYALAHYGFAVEDFSDPDGGFFVEEGDDDSAEGFERGPGVYGSRGIDEVSNRLEIWGAEDFDIAQIGYEERV